MRREKQVSPRMPGGFTREQMREVARNLGVKRGRNTNDTLANLKEYVERRGLKFPWSDSLGLDKH